jgi:ABC-type Mn2+/Zn2+ transport system permease subunit
MLSKSNVAVFIISFLISVLGSFFGLLFCYKKDFPAGPSIVAILGGIFIIVSIYKLLSLAFVKKA